jgi:hypothetical protein
MFHCLPLLGRLGPSTRIRAVNPENALPVSSPMRFDTPPASRPAEPETARKNGRVEPPPVDQARDTRHAPAGPFRHDNPRP